MEIVIIGNSAAGIGAAEAIRKNNSSANISIISYEPYTAYSKPFIKDVLGGKADFDKIEYRNEDFYKKKNINTVFGKKVVSINPEKKTVRLKGGKNVEYDKLLISTGGSTIIPPIKGLDKKHVYQFITYDDAVTLRNGLKKDFKGKKKVTVVVIGGGLIGYSAAVGLEKMGVKVVIVELLPFILNRIFDKESSEIAQKIISSKGIDVITNDSVVAVNGRGKSIGSISLKSKKRIPCDAVIIAAGVKPNLELCKKPKIETNRGIIVDNYLRTNYKDIYAAGDVCEAPDGMSGKKDVVAIWPNAYRQGYFAGFNMINKKRKFPGSYVMNSLDLFGITTISGGLIDASEDNYEILSEQNGESYHYKKVILHKNKVIGYVFVNNIDNAGIYYNLMSNEIDVTKFKQHLLKDDFGYVYIDKSIRKQIFQNPV
ncbi:NAD(P)/FAD-dependent oxidoreductase [bacterium]|nr:NAD(P)/FAD-dependent oxidoreductase [bacterium]